MKRPFLFLLVMCFFYGRAQQTTAIDALLLDAKYEDAIAAIDKTLGNNPDLNAFVRLE